MIVCWGTINNPAVELSKSSRHKYAQLVKRMPDQSTLALCTMAHSMEFAAAVSQVRPQPSEVNQSAVTPPISPLYIVEQALPLVAHIVGVV